MTLSMHQASIPVFLRALANLRAVLGKGAAFANERDIAPEVMLQMRMLPDMIPLVRQVQIATDMAKNAAARLAGTELLPFDDDETTFVQLDELIERASAYLRGFAPDQIDGSETRAITMKTPSRELTFEGQAYLLQFVLPNLFFHCTIVYALLRQSGVALGKMDFLGRED